MWTGWPLLESNGGSDNPFSGIPLPTRGVKVPFRVEAMRSRKINRQFSRARDYARRLIRACFRLPGWQKA